MDVLAFLETVFLALQFDLAANRFSHLASRSHHLPVCTTGLHPK
jgi:hypothetical protein